MTVTAPATVHQKSGFAFRFRPRVGAALTAALLLSLVWGVTSAQGFLDETNIASTLLNMVELSLLAIALIPVIVVGEIDVSVQGMISLGAALSGVLFGAHLPSLLVFVLVIVLGAVGGLLNAVLVARVRLPSLVVTLGTMALFNGLALVVLGQSVVSDFPNALVNFVNSNFLGLVVPTMTVLMVVLCVALAVFMHLTVPGRRVFFLGKNAQAALHAGIPTARYKAMTFVFAGVVSAVAGLVLALQYASARGDSGAGLLLPALTAVVLGGVDVRGGRGNVLAVLAALFLTAVVIDIQTLLGWGPEIGQITVGVILVISVTGRTVFQKVRRLFRSGPAPNSVA